MLPRYRGAILAIVSSFVALAAASLLVGVLQGPLKVPNASSVYLVAVVAGGVLFGTWPAVVTAVLGFLFYDFLFVQPLYTFTVADPGEWLNLVLFLLVAVVIGRLTTLQTERANDADRRARESQALFAISRTLATATTVAEAAPMVLARLAAESGMDRIWFGTRTSTGERTVVDSAPDQPKPRAPIHWMLQRMPGDQPARWVRAHTGSEPGRAPKAPADALFRVKVEAESDVVGSLWAGRAVKAGLPSREETRLLALAADQLGLALRRDALVTEATAAEVARQSDALKSALLTSVSHDLRTPLSSIRAAAGSLLDPAITWSPDDQRAIARSIDTEAERLNRLVRNLLDLSRIEGGALRPDLELFELDELLEPVLARLEPVLAGRRMEVAVPSGAAAGSGRRRLPRRGRHQPARERGKVRRRRRPDPDLGAARGANGGGAHDRGQRSGSAGGRVAAPLRKVLSRASRRRGLATRHGHRPERGQGPGRGDGRQRQRQERGRGAAWRSTFGCRWHLPPRRRRERD